MSHGKCEFGKYELLYRCSLVNLKVVNLLFGTNELTPAKGPERGGGTQPSDDFFGVGSGRRSACAMGK